MGQAGCREQSSRSSVPVGNASSPGAASGPSQTSTQNHPRSPALAAPRRQPRNPNSPNRVANKSENHYHY